MLSPQKTIPEPATESLVNKRPGAIATRNVGIAAEGRPIRSAMSQVLCHGAKQQENRNRPHRTVMKNVLDLAMTIVIWDPYTTVGVC